MNKRPELCYCSEDVKCSNCIRTIMIRVSIIALVGALAMGTLNTQQTFAIASVGNAGQGRAGGGSSGAGEGTYIDPSLFCNTGVTTPICTSSNTASNLLHPRPLINHLSVTSHPTINIPKQHSKITPNNADVAHVSSNTPSNLLHPRPLINHLSVTSHPTGDSRGNSRHHYHNISAYAGSSTSSDSRGNSRHHYHTISHKIIIISHHLHHGKSSGYAGSFGGGPGGSFGGGPGGSFGGGPGGSFGGDYDGDYP
jgi:hypothetical protein